MKLCVLVRVGDFFLVSCLLLVARLPYSHADLRWSDLHVPSPDRQPVPRFKVKMKPKNSIILMPFCDPKMDMPHMCMRLNMYQLYIFMHIDAYLYIFTCMYMYI